MKMSTKNFLKKYDEFIYFNNYQIVFFKDDSLNNEIGLGFYKVY